MTLRCSRWRLMQQHAASGGKLFRIKGMGPVYRWLYARKLIQPSKDSMHSELTEAGWQGLARAVLENARHARSTPFRPWGDYRPARESRGTE